MEIDKEQLKQNRQEYIRQVVQQTEQRIEDELREQWQQEQRWKKTHQMPSFAAAMPEHTEMEQTAPLQQRRETYREQKKRKEREAAQQKAQEQKKLVKHAEGMMLAQRRGMLGRNKMDEEEVQAEKALLDEKLKEIALQYEADILIPENASALRKLELQAEAEIERAKVMGQYARMLPIDTAIRAEAMKAKEEQEIKANQLKKKLKNSQIKNPVERKREEATFKRHEKYDAMQRVLGKDNPLSHEDVMWKHPVTQHMLVNVGRAFFGGTKPMYIFEDRQAPLANGGYKQYLFKEAVNCVGIYKPEGALVTAAAAQLQREICGEFAISAFAAVQEDGRVLGSFQEKIDKRQDPVDLFKWQANPDNMLFDDIKNEILREHTLDWLLCNFDTKGENFLHRTDGHLSSFDKEASFGKLEDAEAEHMSTTYKPHANDTIYNVLFTEFAEGRVDLDLQSIQNQLDKVAAISDKKYLKMFDRMLTQKYGDHVPGETNEKRKKAEEKMLQRKNNLQAEYEQFLGGLLRRRAQTNALKKHEDLLGSDGRFIGFRNAAADRVQE